MDKLFDSTWVLRITALVLAILMFFYVKSLLGEGISTTNNNHVDILTDVPVEAYYDTENLIVTGVPETVDVTIEGPIHIVLNTKLKKDFKLFVDLNALLIGEHRVKIQPEGFSDKLSVKLSEEWINVSIEEKVTAELPVEPDMKQGLIDEAYYLDSINVEPSTVFVTGAKSVIASISYIKATVTGNPGINRSFEQEAEVKVLDTNLNKLDVLVEPAKVRVKVGVAEYSRDLPIRIQQVGTPATEGVTLERLTTSTESVQVFGPKSIIDGLTELVVEFDVTEIENSGQYEVNLPVPSGATRLSSSTIMVQANVSKVDAIDDETSNEANTDEETNEDVTNENNNSNE
ncbi:YbbR-like domain-containing protein [Ureibacillus sp. MALMAid1270]|uniref:CdaR family protein n=1 Tax=Ureibacillus sp. MALMAid1270 TaxID=3411629 RepID=UPI003BA5C6CD